MYWKSLTYKNEYKIESNEFALFQALADEVGIIALNIGLDHNLCEALARCSGFAFIDNGIAAWNAIKEYLELNNIDLDINYIKKNIIYDGLKKVFDGQDNELYRYVDELFNKNTILKEVILVKEGHRILKSLQPIKNYNIKLYFDLTAEAFKELKEQFQNNKFNLIDLKKYIPNDMPILETKLSNEEKEELFNEISEKRKDFEKKYPQYSSVENALHVIKYVCVF